MEKQTITRYKWFWAWQDHKEEEWLQSMSLQGWHLVTMSIGFYKFEKGEPANYVYRLDFNTNSSKNLIEYVGLFQDAGWEYLGRLSSWQYFRKLAAPGEEPEIFTDNESKIAKYQRIITFLVILSPVYFVIFFPHMADRVPLPFAIVVGAFYFTLMVIYSVAIVSLARRINQLKRL